MTRTAKLHEFNRGERQHQADQQEAWAEQSYGTLNAGISIPGRRGD